MSYNEPTPEQIRAMRANPRCHFVVPPSPPYREPPRSVLRQLNPAEQARVASSKALIYEHLPELVPLIKELHEAGLIDGWRSVGKIELSRKVEHGTAG